MSIEHDDELTLTDAERGSTLWAKIEAHLQNKLNKYRAKNDGNLQPDETTKLRVRIAELKDLLATGATRD